MTARTLQLSKHGRTFCFRYESGGETRVIDEIVRLTERDDSPLDWTDAAMLSFQVAADAADASDGSAPPRPHDTNPMA